MWFLHKTTPKSLPSPPPQTTPYLPSSLPLSPPPSQQPSPKPSRYIRLLTLLSETQKLSLYPQTHLFSETQNTSCSITSSRQKLYSWPINPICVPRRVTHLHHTCPFSPKVMFSGSFILFLLKKPKWSSSLFCSPSSLSPPPRSGPSSSPVPWDTGTTDIRPT